MKKISVFVFILCVSIANLLSQTKSDSLSADSTSGGVSYKILPYAFYHNTFKGVVGLFAGIKGFAQEQTTAKIGGLASINGSYYGYCIIEDLQMPYFNRLYIRPDLYVGRLGSLKRYIGVSKNGAPAGSNNSDEGSFIELEGSDVWVENTFKVLLPIGDGKDKVILNPKFKKGKIISGIGGGSSLNPFESGRSFIGVKTINRYMDLKNDKMKLKQETNAAEFFISHENMDYFFNPTIGTHTRLSYTIEPGWFGSTSKSQILKGEFNCYLPLYDRNSDDSPRVLAFHFHTADTPSWWETEIKDGKTVYHRPQLFAGANLGGLKYLRGYKDYRFYDKASIYYSAELRQNLPWNPFNEWEFTRKIGIDFIQAVAFFDLGRVAPEWKLKTLHTDMKYSVGGGLRIFIDGMVARLDVAYGNEGAAVQMFIDHPF
jgi:hypothetical protein